MLCRTNVVVILQSTTLLAAGCGRSLGGRVFGDLVCDRVDTISNLADVTSQCFVAKQRKALGSILWILDTLDHTLHWVSEDRPIARVYQATVGNEKDIG